MIRNLATGVDAFTSNVYFCPGERPALVDAGNDFDVTAGIREHGEDLDVVALTHTHPDHVGALAEITAAFDVTVVAFDGDAAYVDRELDDGEVLALGDDDYEVIHTPGHEPNHCCFYARDPGRLFVGDLVFANGAFGRTDLEGADRATLCRSIDRLLETVDDLTAMYPGHGPAVTDEPREHIELAARAART